MLLECPRALCAFFCVSESRDSSLGSRPMRAGLGTTLDPKSGLVGSVAVFPFGY